MMEFWPEHQGQSPLYARFGTLPGRNYTHNYHDRHQSVHYPLYYGEQQDPSRESGYWTVPGSRAGGAPRDYANWADQEISATTSAHFPFILDRHTKQHQDLGEYQPHEARDRDWTAAQRAARECDKGLLREGWQRRWGPCSPVPYNRDVSIKRSDSSYRELEAWAARYSHSLPRRRRIEAELRGDSQGLFDSSRAPERGSRSVTDPRATALPQVRQSANIRESGVWDRGGRLQTLTCYPAQAHVPDTSHMLDMKEKSGYQTRMLSQPPGYIAPPPYNSPHKSSPVIHQCNSSWEQTGKRHAHWSQPTPRKQNVSIDLQDNWNADKEDCIKRDGKKTCAELNGLKLTESGFNTLQTGSPISVPSTHTQLVCTSSLQQPQMIPAIQDTKTNEQTSSKIIEGRKFRLNKKTGGMTIFCLVSRIANTTETLLCTSQAISQSTEPGEVSKALRASAGEYQTQKLADEVDFRAAALTEQSNTCDTGNLKAEQMDTPTCVESKMVEVHLSNEREPGVVSPEKSKSNNASDMLGKQIAQSVQPGSVKYPLWRQPSFTSRAETDSSSTSLKANSEEGESHSPQNQEECAPVHPIDVEVRRLDIKEDTQTEDSKDLLVIDTTCVVVKVELIPSPKKEHVHYFSSSSHAEDSLDEIQSDTCPESNSQLYQEETLNTETNTLQINERRETELDFDRGEKQPPEGGGDMYFPCTSSSSICGRETVEERAERILGIRLHDCMTEHQLKDAASLLDSSVEKQDVETLPSPIPNSIYEAGKQPSGDTTEEVGLQLHLKFGPAEDTVRLKESDDVEDEVKNQVDAHFPGHQDQASPACGEEDIDFELETDIKSLQETKTTEEILPETTSDESTAEQSELEGLHVESDRSSQHLTQCFSPSKDTSDATLLSLFSLTAPSFVSQSNTTEALDPQLAALDTTENLGAHPETSPLPYTPLQQLPSPVPPGSTRPSPSDTPHLYHSLSPPLLLLAQTADALSGIEHQEEDGETSQLINNEVSDAFEIHGDQEVVSLEQFEYEQTDNASCVKESNINEEQRTKEGERESSDTLEQTPELSKEKAIDVHILQKQPECVQAEEEEQSYMTEEQPQKEASEDPAEYLENLIFEKSVTDGKTQVEDKNLHQQFNECQEQDVSTVQEVHGIERQSQREASEDTDPSVQKSETSRENETDSQVEVDQVNASDSQTRFLFEILQDTETKTEPSDCPSSLPSNSDHQLPPSPSNVPSPPHASPKEDTQPESSHETDSACFSLFPLTADACTPETVPPPVQLNPCEEILQFSSPPTSKSDANLSTSIPSDEAVEGISLDEDEAQCPKSLWDAVNRIRKHTAPDSENEEEEVSEQWDPESTGEDSGCKEVELYLSPEVSDDVSKENVENKVQDLRHEDSSRHAEDDTLSCSSMGSSGDTVIVADDNEGEERPFPMMENKTETDRQFPVTGEEPCCSGDVKEETAAKEEAEDEPTSAEEFTADVGNVTAEATETMEVEQKENEEEGLPPSEAGLVSKEVTG